MNAFSEHHKDSIKFSYGCFDRRLATKAPLTPQLPPARAPRRPAHTVAARALLPSRAKREVKVLGCLRGHRAAASTRQGTARLRARRCSESIPLRFSVRSGLPQMEFSTSVPMPRP